jgi:hypothetical protein
MCYNLGDNQKEEEDDENMIQWNEKLYYGESIKKRHRRMIYAINHGRKAPNIYCIIFASNVQNLFEIIPASHLKLPHIKNSEVHILGLAYNMEEAKEVVMQMLVDIYKATGDFKVREYFA